MLLVRNSVSSLTRILTPAEIPFLSVDSKGAESVPIDAGSAVVAFLLVVRGAIVLRCGAGAAEGFESALRDVGLAIVITRIVAKNIAVDVRQCILIKIRLDRLGLTDAIEVEFACRISPIAIPFTNDGPSFHNELIPPNMK